MDKPLAFAANVQYKRDMRKSRAQISSAPGTYAVSLRLMKFRSIRIGKMGKIDFPAGWYVYVGSALGPGGLGARIGRHHRMTKKKHWHIDYLRPATRVEGYFVVSAPVRREHEWAQCLGSEPIAGQPVVGFGSSDCSCAAHLYYFEKPPLPEFLSSSLNARWIRSR